MFRVGVDVGGTFTDFLISDLENGNTTTFKYPTTPKNPAIGIVEGLRQSGIGISQIKMLMVSTTVVTNALVMATTPRAAVITTRGFRGVLEIKRGTREDIWDHYKDPAPPLVKRRDIFEVDERVDYSGAVLKPLDERQLKDAVSVIKSRGINVVVVHFINSYMNPINEARAVEVVKSEMPGAFVYSSHEVNPEPFEFERLSTTVINAVSAPVVKEFMESLGAMLAEHGFRGTVLLVHQGGGVMTPHSALRYAARLAGSGPIAGALGALAVASVMGLKNVIGFDSGGTTVIASLIHNGEIRMRTEWWITYGAPIRIPAPDVVTIGAGGGSVAWIDEAKVMHVGPISMGADPGPACYGRGGTEPTLTDANVLTGRISPAMFLGGRMTIYPELAEKAIAAKIAKPLGMDVMEAAEGIIQVAVTNMANAVRLISISRGYDPRDFTMVAFGGSGPLHAYLVARELGIPKVAVPPWPGITSAFGTLTMDVRHDMMQSFIRQLGTLTKDELNTFFRKMEESMMKILESEGFTTDKIRLSRALDMRYFGQWRSLTIAFNDGDDLKMLADKFHSEHEREYAYSDPAREIEVYAVRLTGTGLIEKVTIPEVEKGMKDAHKGYRSVYFGNRFEKFAIYDRSKLGAGSQIHGPAIVEQMDTTILLPAGGKATVDKHGVLVMEVS
ncbi:MAG: hydantoinase/oxoprolinase family protein [Candidatus Caldarchaeum sp.]|nr:hydantoinase/oxoprolinase family protein [Candidatus Caldarchaeum sp.]